MLAKNERRRMTDDPRPPSVTRHSPSMLPLRLRQRQAHCFAFRAADCFDQASLELAGETVTVAVFIELEAGCAELIELSAQLVPVEWRLALAQPDAEFFRSRHFQQGRLFFGGLAAS